MKIVIEIVIRADTGNSYFDIGIWKRWKRGVSCGGPTLLLTSAPCYGWQE